MPLADQIRAEQEEMLYAIRFKNHSDRLTETYYIVFDEDGKNPRKEISNNIITKEDLENNAEALIEQDGEFTVLGVTQGAYFLGLKSVGLDMREISSKRLKNIYTKENQIQILINKFEQGEFGSDMDQVYAIIDRIQNASDKDYNAYVEQQIKETEEEYFQTITEQEAEEKLKDYLLKDTKHDIAYKHTFTEQMIKNRTLVKNTKLDNN